MPPNAMEEQEGHYIPLDNGAYELCIFGIDASLAVDDGTKDQDTPADIVVILKPTRDRFTPPSVESSPFTMDHDFIFSTTQKRGIFKLNITGKVKVFRTVKRAKKFVLKPSSDWPGVYGDYDMLLEDESKVSKGDTCIVESVRVSEVERVIYCKFIKKAAQNKGHNTGASSVLELMKNVFRNLFLRSKD